MSYWENHSTWYIEFRRIVWSKHIVRCFCSLLVFSFQTRKADYENKQTVACNILINTSIFQVRKEKFSCHLRMLYF